jgi:hypothetical protein
MPATSHDNNIVAAQQAAAQHGRSTKHGTNIGHRQQHKGKKVETIIHHAKQPQQSVHDGVFE